MVSQTVSFLFHKCEEFVCLEKIKTPSDVSESVFLYKFVEYSYPEPKYTHTLIFNVLRYFSALFSALMYISLPKPLSQGMALAQK
jgi:hypothetical protein